MGGITGFLHSLGYAIRNVNPTKVIIIFDGKGGSQRRRKLYPEYKGNRKTRKNPLNSHLYKDLASEDKSMENQLKRLVEYLQVLPVQLFSIDNIEADDAIAYATQYLGQKHPNSEYYIMSTDQDFLQLVNEQVMVWSPTKKKFYNEKVVLEEFGIPAKNYIYAKVLMGDSGDNVPAIPGWGLKTIRKRMPILCDETEINSLEPIFNYTEKHLKEAKVYKTLLEQKEQAELNFQLMNLHGVVISGTTKETIRNLVDAPVNRLVKHKFIQMLVGDSLNAAIKSPDMFIKDNFWKLDVFAGM